MSISDRIDTYVEAAGEVIDSMPPEHILAVYAEPGIDFGDRAHTTVETIDNVYAEEFKDIVGFLVHDGVGKPRSLYEFAGEFSMFSQEKRDEYDTVIFRDAFVRALEIKIFSRRMNITDTPMDFYGRIQDSVVEYIEYPEGWDEDE